MAFSVTDFKAQAISRGGYRPTLFEVEATYIGNQFNFLCTTSQVPALTVNPIEVGYFGRKIKIAGDRTYAEWTTSVLVEEDFGARDALERWSMDINRGDTNTRALVGEEYKRPVRVKLYGKDGSVIRVYQLEGCWPTDVGTIELDWDSNDTIGRYDVTWAFDWMNAGF